MDNILKALNRAKKSHPADQAENSAYYESNQYQKGGISYTKTKVVNADLKLLRNNRVITGLGSGSAFEAYRLLRTQVLQRMREHEWNALAITSPTEHTGKTLTAVNLAISMAMEVNQTVLLVDLDLRKPSLHDYFGYQPEKGISDYINSGTPLSQILFNPSIERLVVLPGRETILNSSETLSAPIMVNLVNELKNRYPSRFLLFDLPPILSADDVLAFSPYVDAALIVVEDGMTTSPELAQSLEILNPVNIIGTVMNKGRS
jgi:capsular exopolysaccharide synthesis family protein